MENELRVAAGVVRRSMIRTSVPAAAVSSLISISVSVTDGRAATVAARSSGRSPPSWRS
jgi:uncharacterized membrane protein